MASRTVRRSSIEARTMWDRALSATSYTLSNYFSGQPVEVGGAHAWYDRVARAGHTRITYSPATGDYTIHYHSNHWTVLHTRAAGSSRRRVGRRSAPVHRHAHGR